MNQAEQGAHFFKLYDDGVGLSYREIADAYGLSRNSVAARIFEHRKRHGIAATHKNRTVCQTKRERIAARKKRINRVFESGRKERNERQEAIDQSFRRPDGALVCPPRYALGYTKPLRFGA